MVIKKVLVSKKFLFSSEGKQKYGLKMYFNMLNRWGRIAEHASSIGIMVICIGT